MIKCKLHLYALFSVTKQAKRSNNPPRGHSIKVGHSTGGVLLLEEIR